MKINYLENIEYEYWGGDFSGAYFRVGKYGNSLVEGFDEDTQEWKKYKTITLEALNNSDNFTRIGDEKAFKNWSMVVEPKK